MDGHVAIEGTFCCYCSVSIDELQSVAFSPRVHTAAFASGGGVYDRTIGGDQSLNTFDSEKLQLDLLL
jgi:hypothetical protein